jgi:siroheme synthase-like protein
MSAHFPVFLKLEGRSVLLVGAGKVAYDKLQRLVGTGARIHVVAREVGPDVARLAAAHPETITVERRDVRGSDIVGHALVINATNDPESNAAVTAAARAAGIWSNAVDDVDASDFYTAGVVRRGPLTIAVASEGRFPGLVRAVRACLDQLLPASHEPALEELAAMRAALKERLPDATERFRVLRRLGEELRRDYFTRS